MDSVIVIPALGDNFIYLCVYEQSNALAMYQSEAAVVFRELRIQDAELTHILVTHHHMDHTGGIAKLKKATGCNVLGCDKRRIPQIDQLLHDGDCLTFGTNTVRVIATPGHTHTSVCYYHPSTGPDDEPMLWTGDTLFVSGCGRILECDARTMRYSLLKLAGLPEETLVWPGHNYTIENYEFTLTVEPDNETAIEQLELLKDLDNPAKPVPSTIGREKMTNPFLRADNKRIRKTLNLPDAPAVDVFAELRKMKDFF